MRDINDEVVWFFAFMLVAGWFFDWTDKFYGVTTVYDVACPGLVGDGGECIGGGEPIARKYVFRAIPEKQAVVVLKEGSVYRQDDCVVFNYANWRCVKNSFGDELIEGDYARVVGDEKYPAKGRWAYWSTF